MNRLLIGNLNINSISNRLDQLKCLVPVKVEPYCFDRNRNGSGVLIYVREDIPSKTLPDHNYRMILKEFLLN